MASWLARTTQLLRPHPAPEPPPPFELDCACGHHVSGIRKPTSQAVTCHRCGNLLFVLPIDVYPKPKAKKPAAKPPHLSVLDPAQRISAAQPVPVPSTPVKGGNPVQAAGSAAPAGQSRAAALRAELAPPDPATTVVRRPFLSRLRLIVLAMGSVVTATGYFVWQSRLNDRALVSLPGHVEAGEAALRGGNLPVAAEEYRQAAWAVNRLGREDAESAGIRQKARELNAIAKLSTVSLYDICEQARVAAPAGAEKWTEKFNQLYRDLWFVIEGDVIQDSGPDGVEQAMVRFPFPIDSAPVVIDARLTALAPFSGKGSPRHVIFAGQLASLTKEGTKNAMWMIRLKDESTFVWADFDTYQALGLGANSPGDDNDAHRILSQQAAALGLKP